MAWAAWVAWAAWTCNKRASSQPFTVTPDAIRVQFREKAPFTRGFFGCAEHERAAQFMAGSLCRVADRAPSDVNVLTMPSSSVLAICAELSRIICATTIDGGRIFRWRWIRRTHDLCNHPSRAQWSNFWTWVVYIAIMSG